MGLQQTLLGSGSGPPPTNLLKTPVNIAKGQQEKAVLSRVDRQQSHDGQSEKPQQGFSASYRERMRVLIEIHWVPSSSSGLLRVTSSGQIQLRTICKQLFRTCSLRRRPLPKLGSVVILLASSPGRTRQELGIEVDDLLLFGFL